MLLITCLVILNVSLIFVVLTCQGFFDDDKWYYWVIGGPAIIVMYPLYCLFRWASYEKR